MTASTIPDHVPADAVRDFDYVDMRGETDLYEHFRKLLDGPDIFYSPHHGGHWVATRFADMEAIFTDPETFSSRHQSLPPQPMQLTLIEWDGQIHTDARRVLAPFFKPSALGNLEQVARDLTISLIEGFKPSGHCEFVGDFAQKMPIIIMMDLLGFPTEDTDDLMGIAEGIVRAVDPAVQMAAFVNLQDYIAHKILPARRAHPGNDMISAILAGRIDGGRPFTEPELVSFGGMLIGAGLDTVMSTLGFLAQFLAESPTHRQQLVDDPDLIPIALEEMIRRFQIINISRVVTRDVEFKGHRFKAGDRILTPTPAAGLDERHYPDPFTVDFARPDKRTLMFGRGPHQCIGAALARIELRVFLQEWLRRVPHFTITPGEVPVAVPGKACSMRYLPLSWET